jgi:hypothetical protein
MNRGACKSGKWEEGREALKRAVYKVQFGEHHNTVYTPSDKTVILWDVRHCNLRESYPHFRKHTASIFTVEILLEGLQFFKKIVTPNVFDQYKVP